jgi:hypothetical protein
LIRNRKFILITILISLFTGSSVLTGTPIGIPDHQLWPRPVIIPLPSMTSGVQNPVTTLNGVWKINMDPPEEFWLDNVDNSTWKDIPVPASADMLGFRIQPDKQYAYKSKFWVPADYKGKRIILRFEGVTGTAKVWINGNLLKEHFGGFNIWNCDITEFVKSGEENWLTVGIVEESKRTSSGFNTGGIIRSVKIVALPQDYIMRFNVETDLDESYKNATMKVWLGVEFNRSKKMAVSLTLKDPDGRSVAIRSEKISLTSKRNELIVPVAVTNPIKWDAEHPVLYTLEASIIEKGRVVQMLTKKIGFREVEIKGVRMFVNGMEIKLRGGGRFDSDPVYGKYLSPGQSYKEVRMLKNANLNFVRPSCYPTTEDYFDACDSIGLYVQAENAVTFSRGSQNDTTYTDIYMNQMAEMIEADRSHPSIIIWELANETGYGINIGKTYEYARAEDPTRPVIYSWSQSVPPDKPWPYEIFSYHYPDWDQDLGKPGVAVFNGKPARPLPEGMPVLHDEFAHGSAYYPVSLARDPGMRNFWGESIKRFWERMFSTDGCLGGAIWAVIDENATGGWAYEWGMIDLWRRERPEYWLMKKAYSPVRIKEGPVENPGQGNPLTLPVKNWYDHTNFSELTIKWSAGSRTGTFRGPDILPHESGTIDIPAVDWKNDDILNLKFYDSYGMYTDEYNIPVSPSEIVFPGPGGPAPAVKENEDSIIITGRTFEIIFSKSDGLIKKGSFRNKEIITGGPYFNLVGGEPLKNWKLQSLSFQVDNSEVIVNVTGQNDPVEISYEIRIDGDGLITTSYKLNKFSVVPPKATKIPWNNQDGGGFEEVGISYMLTSDIDKFGWKRNSLWSVYPEEHIGRPTGIALRHIPGEFRKFGTEPLRSWSQEELDFSVYGPYDIGGRGTNDFRSMKENIITAFAVDSKSGNVVKIESDGAVAVRMEVQPDRTDWIDNNDPSIHYSGTWIQVTDTAEYFNEKEYRSTEAGDFAELSFIGTGIAWIGTKGNISGAADVFIDGELLEESLGFSTRGKTGPQSIIFSKQGLSPGKHIIKIVARTFSGRMQGRRQNMAGSAEPGIPVDGFIILSEKPLTGEVKMVINNLWNHTKMGLGNFMKDPVLIDPGYSNNVKLHLIDLK